MQKKAIIILAVIMCMETESWLKLIFFSGSINEEIFKKYRNLCGRIRRMLTSSCITIENKLKQG